ncbi:hypothetical protein EV284_6394 [Streptomyces sp. BK022]|uniref:hypothetical protein n=1 Tax=Streptomyces sp. BK022 TaxID=2512123 RepID=UPI001029FAA1|nr:hypothetical protein [Streptomyces sp. BK022]RZU28228.1 hypothetical protein EV284_6394 [Streptomyces sp. BK022]
MTPALLALKPEAQLYAQYGPMRAVVNTDGSADTPREQADAFVFNLLGGKKIRESVINGADGHADLIIRCVEYIDPVTQKLRWAVDYWSIHRHMASDHSTLALAELSYEKAVRDEFAEPTLTLSLERFTRGLASFYDVTDVI